MYSKIILFFWFHYSSVYLSLQYELPLPLNSSLIFPIPHEFLATI